MISNEEIAQKIKAETHKLESQLGTALLVFRGSEGYTCDCEKNYRKDCKNKTTGCN